MLSDKLQVKTSEYKSLIFLNKSLNISKNLISPLKMFYYLVK